MYLSVEGVEGQLIVRGRWGLGVVETGLESKRE